MKLFGYVQKLQIAHLVPLNVSYNKFAASLSMARRSFFPVLNLH